MQRICVFCGSSDGSRKAFADAARALGAELVRRKLSLVYGGGRVGLMGVLADAVLAAGGAVTGVIPRPLATKELAHDSLTELRVVSTMHERKALMTELADAFVALPGGLGTFEELLEILTWAQLGIHQKPCGILNVEGYYDPLLGLLDHAVTERFVRPEHRSIVLSRDEPALLLDALRLHRPAVQRRWLADEET